MPTILLLDDDSGSLETLAASLAQYTVVDCNRPQQALRRLRQHRFDLLWMRLPLIGLEPVEFVHRIQRIQPALPIITVSAVPMALLTLRRCKAFGTFVVLNRDPPRRMALALTAAVLQLPAGPSIDISERVRVIVDDDE